MGKIKQIEVIDETGNAYVNERVAKYKLFYVGDKLKVFIESKRVTEE